MESIWLVCIAGESPRLCATESIFFRLALVFNLPFLHVAADANGVVHLMSRRLA